MPGSCCKLGAHFGHIGPITDCDGSAGGHDCFHHRGHMAEIVAVKERPVVLPGGNQFPDCSRLGHFVCVCVGGGGGGGGLWPSPLGWHSPTC